MNTEESSEPKSAPMTNNNSFVGSPDSDKSEKTGFSDSH
mgnify:CR=1 FL=1